MGGFVHGGYEGEGAAASGCLHPGQGYEASFVHYGKVVEDVPAVEELAANM